MKRKKTSNNNRKFNRTGREVLPKWKGPHQAPVQWIGKTIKIKAPFMKFQKTKKRQNF